jgi:thiopurine S-methyltransferase
MKKDFWLERWERAEIGFHQDEINQYLIRYWPKLNVAVGSTVFVPLCGKSRDMLWLRDQGYEVVGVELSPVAVRAFFEENGLEPTISYHNGFDQCEASHIRLLCGDFFQLGKDDIPGVNAVFDRASLVALPPEMRKQYVRLMLEILPHGTEILLISFEYDQSKMSGPPFAVTREEVYQLYSKATAVELLAHFDTLDGNQRFRARGLDHLFENIFRITV